MATPENYRVPLTQQCHNSLYVRILIGVGNGHVNATLHKVVGCGLTELFLVHTERQVQVCRVELLRRKGGWRG